jgi:hypothetical protein
MKRRFNGDCHSRPIFHRALGVRCWTAARESFRSCAFFLDHAYFGRGSSMFQSAGLTPARKFVTALMSTRAAL